MSSCMNYKGYVGSIEFSEEDQVFYGKLVGIKDLVSYEGNCADSLIRDFREAVDDYLESCRADGRAPDKPFKGSFNVRIRPELHREAVLAASARGLSLNAFVEDAIKHSI